MPIETPDVVRALEGRINTWNDFKEVITIVPKNANFDEIYILKKKLFLSLDQKSIFVGIVNIAPQERKNREKLYQKLKGMECELERGFLWRNLRFKRHHDLFALKRGIPSLELDDTVINRLNEEEQLINILKKIKPEMLTITLATAAPHYNNRSKITWEIAITKMVQRGLNYKKTTNRIFDTFEIVSKILKENLTR